MWGKGGFFLAMAFFAVASIIFLRKFERISWCHKEYRNVAMVCPMGTDYLYIRKG